MTTLALTMLVQRAPPSAGASVLSLIPAVLLDLIASGFLTVISGPNGFRLVDPKRTPEQMAYAYRSLAEPPQPSLDPTVNVDDTPMVGGFDAHGNPYGVTNHH